MHEAPQLDFQLAQQFTCAPQAKWTAIYMAPCTPTGTFRLTSAHKDSPTGRRKPSPLHIVPCSNLKSKGSYIVGSSNSTSLKTNFICCHSSWTVPLHLSRRHALLTLLISSHSCLVNFQPSQPSCNLLIVFL